VSERQMTIILLIVLGAIVLLGAGALYWLQFQELSTLQEELDQVSKKVVEATEKRDKIKDFERRVKDLTETIERIRGQIPIFNPKEENDAFADLVDHLRKKCRVQISGARYSAAKTGGPGEPTIPGGIFRARYEYRVTGGFYQLLNFMNHLETERRFLVLDGIKLAAGNVAEGRGQPVRELVLNISTFLQRPSAALPGAPEAKPAEKPGEAPEETRRLSTPIPD